MLDVNICKNGEYYNVEITDGKKVFEMIFGGNLDLHWNIYCINNAPKEKSISIDITKDNYVLWELFDDLYNDFKGCNILKVSNIELEFCENSEDVKKLYDRCKRYNEFLKETREYNDVFDGKSIKWISDDESYNMLTITPMEDKYVLQITTGKKISYLERYGIRFRNSGSMHKPFEILFMKLYNNIISGEYDFNQVHINEYIKKLKKHH